MATEAWGWLPPPLHHEGDKGANRLAARFPDGPDADSPGRRAADAELPHVERRGEQAGGLLRRQERTPSSRTNTTQRRRSGYLAELEQAHPELLNDAMKIVTDGNYCVKCHSVGDYQVTRRGQDARARIWIEVYRRLRPDYVRRWVGNPQRILPYTGMPVNIPYDPTPPNFGGVNQALFPGPSIVQLDGVVDLLMNFDEYTRRQTSVKGLVKEPPPGGQPPAGQPPRPSRRQHLGTAVRISANEIRIVDVAIEARVTRTTTVDETVVGPTGQHNCE